MFVRVSPCAHKTDLVASHYVFPEQRKLFQKVIVEKSFQVTRL
jgi:hypothetical protein